jgi:hypothetical protein
MKGVSASTIESMQIRSKRRAPMAKMKCLREEVRTPRPPRVGLSAEIG